jgi:hypothetical protein
LIIISILLLVGASPTWPYARNWGSGPSGILDLLSVVLFVLLILDVVRWGRTAGVVVVPPRDTANSDDFVSHMQNVPFSSGISGPPEPATLNFPAAYA